MEGIGHAVHGFLASDCVEQGYEQRLGHDREVLDRWGVNALQPDTLLLASNRLRGHLKSAYPGMRIQTEVPIQGRIGLQRVSGRIDLLLVDEFDTVIVDHKTFPGPYDTWLSKAHSYASQLAIYSELVEGATNQPVSSCWVHLPVIGKLIQLCIEDVAVRGAKHE